MIEFRTLGQLELRTSGGAELSAVVRQPRRLALLTFLVAAGRQGFVRRDQLFGMFWPEEDAPRAHASLRQALYCLRRDIDEALTVTRGDDEVRLDADVIWCDAVAFDVAILRGALEDAVGLYQGPFLHAFHVRGAPEFERWMGLERGRLSESYAQSLRQLAEAAARRQEHTNAAIYLRKLAAHDPYSTNVTLSLMEALERSGNRVEAIRCAEQHADRLEAEFDASPSPDVMALAQRLRAEPESLTTRAAQSPEARFRAAVSKRYKLRREIGRGSMGVVYLAWDLKHTRHVAVKVVRPELAASLGADQFLREIGIAARLNHPHIISLHDSGMADGLLYYVMPYIEGESLRHRLNRDKALPVEEALKIAQQVAAALSYAHSSGLVHRDVKPENILLHHGEALVADFGVAGAISSAGDDRLTDSGLAIGTPAYMSPEQATGNTELDGRTDIYSLACVLFETLAGQPPFTGVDAQAVISRQVLGAPPRIRSLRFTVPDYVEASIEKALAKTPTDRFATPTEFAEALRGSDTLRHPPQHAPTSPRRRQQIWLYASFVALVLVIGGVLLRSSIMRGDGSSAWSWTATSAHALGGPSFTTTGGQHVILGSYLWDSYRISSYDGVNWIEHTLPDSMVLRDHVAVNRFLARFVDGSLNLVTWDPLSEPIHRTRLSRPEGEGPHRFWSDGSAMFAWSVSRPSVFHLENGSWIEQPTGDITVRRLVGSEVDGLFAIGRTETRDGILLQYNGVDWVPLSIRSPTWTGRPSFHGGFEFNDGAATLVGRLCEASQCRPLIVQRESATSPWYEVEVTTSEPARADHNALVFSGVFGLSSSDYFVWGQHHQRPNTCLPGGQCVWHVSNGEASPERELTGVTVESTDGMAALDDAIYAMMDDGTFRRHRSNTWHIVAEAAGSSWEHVVYVPTVGPLAIKGDQMIPMASLDVTTSMQAPDSIARVAAFDTTLAILTRGGQIFQIPCVQDLISLSSVNEARNRRGEPPLTETAAPRTCDHHYSDVVGSPSMPFNDIGFLPDGTLVGVGDSGLVASWDGKSLQLHSVPAQLRSENWLRVRGESQLVLGKSHVASLGTERSQTSALDRRLVPAADWIDFVSLPNGELVAAQGGPMIHFFPASPDSVSIMQLAGGGASTRNTRVRLHLLGDGRLIAAFGRPADPSRGGWLHVWRPPIVNNEWRRVELPRISDITDITDDGKNLYVVGSGWFAMTISLDSLPFAEKGRITATYADAAMAGFIVNTTDDVDDGVCDANHCSLREAINAANARHGEDKIAFRIRGQKTNTIRPTSALPTITDRVIIDGFSQPGARPNSNPIELGVNALLKIELDGSRAGSSANGLHIAAADSKVRGLAINRFRLHGVLISGANATGNVVEGNFLGTDATGTQKLGNGFHGVRVSEGASGNMIGGTTPEARNVISGNHQHGIRMYGANTTANTVQGNFLGTDVTGAKDLGNTMNGITIMDGASGTVIGGTTPGTRNVISGNDYAGINILSGANTVHGNFIGTDASGTKDLGNGRGVLIQRSASGNTVGGTTPGAGNVVSGNDQDGVVIVSDASDNLVQGNLIGTDVTGTHDLGNSHNGVHLTAGTSRNLIGGTTPEARNIISGNDGSGVLIGDLRTSGNAILGNSIYSNSGLGIDLNADGVTPNDPGDTDTGPNNLMNFPVLISAQLTSTALIVTGTVDTRNPQTVTIELFSNAVPAPGADPSAHGEGSRFLGKVVPNALGEFTATLPPVQSGSLITATATDRRSGNTSEFAANIEANSGS